MNDGATRGHLIAGDEVPAASGATFESLDPATAGPIATLARGGAADVDRAVSAARTAQPGWRDVDVYERGRILQRLADLIESNADELTALEARDAGKLLPEAARDVDRAVRTWTYYAGWPTKITGTTNPADPGVFSYTLREPLGVVGAITPWNFPLVIASWKLAPALACGNAVVHKPAEEAPLSALRLAELALEAGVPAGVWNVVTGDAEAGAALAAHDDVDKVSFTGSTEVGREIQRAAAGNLKRLTLELGGKSANIVLEDADVDAALEGAMRATFRNQGQVCTAGARLVVHARHVDELADRLAERVGSIRLGRPDDPGAQMGPLVSARQRERVLALYESARCEGARTATGGGAAVVEGAPNGFFVEPTVFVDTTNAMRINREEIFGPAVAVIRVEDADEAVRVANDTRYGLAAAVWTRDASRAHKIARSLNAGTVWINNYGGLDVYSAYGGRGYSGYGYEQGPQTIEEYTTLKTVRQTL
ncbi:MAG: aldehyde dehydrogenase [Thermoleophilia bacterium]|nr:aldehyde dehydrogenase [Thermoleophilia bacterium]